MVLTEEFPPSFADPVRVGAIERPTGREAFDAMTKDEQDEAYGPDVAEALRNGDVTLADFVHREDGYIRAKPAKDVLPE